MEIIVAEDEYRRLVRLFHCSLDRPRHVVAECTVCGAGRWLLSSEGARQIEIREDESGRCATCAAVMNRAPEVYEWVLGVVAKSRRGASNTDGQR
jgi:hypothetical protein